MITIMIMMKMMTTTMKIYPIKKLTVLPTWETLSKLSSTENKTRGKKIWKVNHILVTCLTSFNWFTSKSDQHLISPYNITLESHIKVARIIGMITNYRSSWLFTIDTLTSRSITIILQKNNTSHMKREFRAKAVYLHFLNKYFQLKCKNTHTAQK